MGIPARRHVTTQPDEEDQESQDEMDEPTNHHLYDQLFRQAPAYDWQIHSNRSMDDFDTIPIPTPTEPIRYLVRGKQHDKGCGQANVSLKHPQYYVEIVRRWFNGLRWKPCVQGPNSPPGTATLLECVVGFELTTGHSLATVKAEVLSWAEKAKRLACYSKVLARTHLT